MRTLVLLGWLMVPVVFGAYHYGPGQEKLRLDDVSRARGRGRPARGRRRVASAPRPSTRRPSALLPEGRVDEARRIRLQRAKVQMFGHQLPEANAALRELVDQLEDDKTADPKLRDEAREALANAQYYMTWLMRLEGLGADEWEPEIESSRQTYRLLAEQDRAKGDRESAAQASRGPRERHPPGPTGSRRAARSRSSQAVPGVQERPVQETREKAVARSPPGKKEEKKDARRPEPDRRRITRGRDRLSAELAPWLSQPRPGSRPHRSDGDRLQVSRPRFTEALSPSCTLDARGSTRPRSAPCGTATIASLVAGDC